MSDIYFLDTRLRAMRAKLLSRRDYEKILALPDLSGVVSALRESPYGRSIDSVGGGTTDVARIEEALRRDFSDTLSRLRAISSGDCGEAVRFVLGRWELQAVKTVVRGKAVGASAGEILSALVPTGLHDEAALEEMCRQPDLRALANLLVTWREPWGPPLLRALNEYREPRELHLLESALDRSWFRQAEDRLRSIRPPGPGPDGEGALSLFVSLSVDTTNLLTALNAVEERIVMADRGRHFLPGGRILERNAFDRILASPTLAEALEEASVSLFRRPLAALPSHSEGIPFLAVVERAVDRVPLRAFRALFRADPLGWGALVSYLLDKLREVRNLRTIVRAKLVDLPEADLDRLLILDY
jgi:V/A-type H+-transporting ATPase subunit C